MNFSLFFCKPYIFRNAKHPGWTTLTTLTTQSTRTDLPTWPIRPPKYSEHSDHPTTFTIPTPDHLDHTQKRTSGTTIKKLSKTTVFKLVGRKCQERQFAKYAICWSRNMIIFEHLIQNDHLQRSCPSQHQSCSERKFPKKICPQNLQKFTEMIRNNNLQIRFTEPHYEKISRTIACKKVSTETICQKKSCRQDNDNKKQTAKKVVRKNNL